MYDFNYRKANSLEDAVKAFSAASEGKYLAGGMSLIPTLKQRLAKPSDVIDLGSIPGLAGITVDKSSVTVGSMTRHFAVNTSADVKKAIPALAKLAGLVGDPAVRYRGTLGGSIANSDPAADYPAAVLGLGATIHTNKRQIPADSFFKGLFETALESGEIITKVVFPIPERSGYMKFPQPASRFALVGVFVAKTGNNVRVAVTGAGPCAFRVPEMEKALSAKYAPESVANLKISDKGLNGDIHASPEYRAHLVTVMAKRAVAESLG
jgi:carbon-monoxide dehydrogenase medium subunit